MKKLLTLPFTLMLVASASLFPSCKGDTGAQGNANVTQNTFTIPSSAWGQTGNVYSDEIGWPVITADIVQNGFVQIYTTSESDPTNSSIWTPLPYTDTYGTYSFDYEVGDAVIYYTSNTASPSATAEYKIIAVAGSVRKMMEQQHINKNDYAAVQHFLLANDIKQQAWELPVSVMAVQKSPTGANK